MIRLLGFLTGLVLVGAALFSVTERSKLPEKPLVKETATENLSRAVKQTVDQATARIEKAVEKHATKPGIVADNASPKAAPTNVPGPLQATDPVEQPTEKTVVNPAEKAAPTVPDSSRDSKPAGAQTMLALAPLATLRPTGDTDEAFSATDNAFSGADNAFGDTAKAQAPTWQPVWNSFHSELSARGFADHLASLTGRSLRVQEEGPARYRVQLAYSDADDLKAALLAISDQTGLDLVGTGR